MKVGMVAIWDKWGVRYPATVLQLDNCVVLQQKTVETDGYTALKLGVGEAKLKNVGIATQGQYLKLGLTPNRKMEEFRVTPDCVLSAGTKISAMHFVAGQVSVFNSFLSVFEI
jgi:large subunit ribosomal protein L3